MRGAVSLIEAYELTVEDRQIINNVIKDNLEQSKKTGKDFW